MSKTSLYRVIRAAALLCPAFTFTFAFAQRAASIISLEAVESPRAEATAVTPGAGQGFFDQEPPNFRAFASAKIGAETEIQTLTLRFAASTRLTTIESQKDFKLESGGSCSEGRNFSAGETCTLLVRFTPQGPGRRLGRITVTHTESATPFSIGLGGNGYAPVVTFTPSIISTVAATYPASAGLLTSAKNLAVDGGDTLYIADSGNNVIRSMDSSGVLKSLATTATNPLGVTVDNFGEVYFDEPSANTMHEVYGYGPVVQVNGTGTASCLAATPCNFNSEAMGTPGTMNMDAYNHLFFVDSHMGSAMGTMQPLPARLIFLYNPFPYQTNPSSAIVADTSDNLYSAWNNGGECEIVRSTLYDAENSNVIFTKIAGGHTCGFNGDGGEAGNAEINAPIGQMTFDLAGNLFFSDTTNQRVRRIDAVTGIITTIAGNGIAGYTGDGGVATSSSLSSPTGVAVDSQGQVYIISGAAASGTAQVVRKVGATGLLYFGNQVRSVASAAKIVTLYDSGNSSLTFTRASITGANAADFTIDPNTTSCLLTAGSTLNSGGNCQIGVIFNPAAAGSRSASLILLDNTVNRSNTVQLSGTGILPTPTFTITSPATGTSVVAGTAVKFAVTVTSASGAAPTGSVSFKADGVSTGSAVTLASGAASTSVTISTVGTHTLSATYNGDANYTVAGPVTRTYTVTAAAMVPVKVALSLATNKAQACSATTFAVAVTSTTKTPPNGKIQLMNGKTIIATGTLTAGKVTLKASLPKAATLSLTAHYLGAAHHPAAHSSTLKVVTSSAVPCQVK